MDMIQETKKYGMFLTMQKDLEADNEHLAEVKASIEKEGLQVPILVDDHMVIIDGMYRFLACKELGLPIKFSLIRDGFTGIAFEQK